MANNKPPMVRSNTFTKEDNNSKLKFRCDNSNSTKMASSPVSSPTRPRINRAAELRLKNNNNGSGSKSRSGSINSIALSSSSTVRKSAERENLRKSCQVIKGCDSKLVEMILNEVIPRGSTGVTWADVSGRGLYILIRRTIFIFNNSKNDMKHCFRSGQGQERPARDGGAANTETRAVHWSPGASQGLVDVRTSGQREDAPGPRPGGGGQQQLDQHQLQQPDQQVAGRG